MLELLSALKLNDDSDQSRITLADVLIMTYASPAWSGFVTATDCQRIDAFLSRSKRRGFCPAELPEFGSRLEKCGDQLFRKTMNSPLHTLHQLLPPQSTASQDYHLRHRTHDRRLPEHHG